ncbi:MAG: hypothetical protein WBL45_11220 [Solirubrobacterales bacterium]
MRTRKLLAKTVAPALLAVTLLGFAPGQASAMTYCANLQAQYNRYAGLASHWSTRYGISHNREHLSLAEEYAAMRDLTAGVFTSACMV